MTANINDATATATVANEDALNPDAAARRQTLARRQAGNFLARLDALRAEIGLAELACVEAVDAGDAGRPDSGGDAHLSSFVDELLRLDESLPTLPAPLSEGEEARAVAAGLGRLIFGPELAPDGADTDDSGSRCLIAFQIGAAFLQAATAVRDVTGGEGLMLAAAHVACRAHEARAGADAAARQARVEIVPGMRARAFLAVDPDDQRPMIIAPDDGTAAAFVASPEFAQALAALKADRPNP